MDCQVQQLVMVQSGQLDSGWVLELALGSVLELVPESDW